MVSGGRVPEDIATRLMDLLALRPRILPALQRPDRVSPARCGVRLAIFELEERASEKEHAAGAASIAFASSVLAHWKDHARSEPRGFPVEWAI